MQGGEVRIKELLGRQHAIPLSGPDMRVADVAAATGPLIGCPADRVQLIYGGRCLDDPTELVAGLNIPPQGCIMAFVKFVLPERLRDGQCHPFGLNGLHIGGDARDDVAAVVGRDEFVRLVEALAVPEAHNPGEANADDSVQLAAEVGLELPECLRQFLALDSRFFSRLACSPIATPRAAWTESFRVLRDMGRVLFCFLFDHQGCCYWYLDVESLQVFVVFGGQTFADGGYLTSQSLWRFLCEYAAVSRQQ
jgi:hypothetical protein